jgi:DUF1365 family protein
VSTSSAWRSALLTGTITHRRLQPFSHGFRYGVVMYRLDLDELDTLNRGLRLFGVDRARPVSFRRADHLPDVRALVRARGIEAPIARVELVTNCRVFGYGFNPVSFYFCYAAGDRLLAIACEVHNTFGESHTYVLTEADGPGRWQEKKVFHVSPFFTLDGTYRFRFTVSDEQLDAGIDLYRDGVAQFVSHLRLVRRPLTDREVLRALLRYPLVTLKVIGAIHWQALRLWWKGAAYRPKPAYDPESARRLTES